MPNVRLHREVQKISRRTGLSYDTCLDLLQRGWKLLEREDTPSVWVSPSAGLPVYIPHDEPVCMGDCTNIAPHKHGLPCNKNCPTCSGICHYSCPAHKKE